MIVVVKPAGLPTAHVPRGEPSLYRWLKRRWGPAAFVGIVSRLDAAVSGVIVAARTAAAASSLAAQFRDRQIAKDYVAIVEGRFPGAVDAWQMWHDAISRPDGQRRSSLGRPIAPRDASTGDSGPPERGRSDGPREGRADTRARVVRRSGEVSLVELQPQTGRRHQLRAQLASRGCPIVGDRLYGSRLPFPAGIALHSRSLGFRHPRDGRPLSFEAAWPDLWTERFPALFRGLASGRPAGRRSRADAEEPRSD